MTLTPVSPTLCATGGVWCGERCVDTTLAVDHCGACGRACVLPHAVPRCELGACAVMLCTDAVDNTVELIADKRKVELAITNIDDIYRQIKKNEESPGTDYLFAGLDKQNTFAKSMEKINIMNSMTM